MAEKYRNSPPSGCPSYICSHTSDSYSPLEKVFVSIIESDKKLKAMAEELNLLHEWRFKGKEGVNGKTKKFTYWLDFFSTKKNVDIEIHHNGHRKGKWYLKKYGQDVFTRDRTRERRLNEKGIKVVEIFQDRLTRGWISFYLKKILSFPDSKNNLDRYL